MKDDRIPSSSSPATTGGVGSHYEVDEVLRDGRRLHIRAIRPDDKSALLSFFGRLSREAIYYRFLGAKKRLTASELAYLTELDFHRKAALVASLDDEEQKRIVGVGRYTCPPGGPDDRAEVALTVEDALQGRGIGTLLLKHLVRVAAAEGVSRFDAFLFADNHRMVHLLEKTGRVIERSTEGGLCHIAISLLDPASS